MNGVDKLVNIITEAWGIPAEQVATDDAKRSLIRIAADLDALFRSRDATRAWLDRVVGGLGGMTPREAIALGHFSQVEGYVGFLSGR